jgi:hypothetical protein
MSSIGTFLKALKSGETLTTKTAERALGRARRRPAIVTILKTKNAFKAPLQQDLRDLLKPNLNDEQINKCIDSWPNTQKEAARAAVANAIRTDRRVRLRWGLSTGSGYETNITKTEKTVTIVARSPRSKLRVRQGGVFVH